VKKNKPPVSRLFVYIFEVVVSVSAFVAFFVLTANGIAVGKWTFALILALVYFFLGTWGIYGWIKKRLEPEIDEEWFSPIK